MTEQPSFFNIAEAATHSLLEREFLSSSPVSLRRRADLGLDDVEAVSLKTFRGSSHPDGVLVFGEALLRIRSVVAPAGQNASIAHEVVVGFEGQFFTGERQPILTRAWTHHSA